MSLQFHLSCFCCTLFLPVFEMSSGSGLITWGIQDNTKRGDDDTDEDAEDLEDLDVEETVVRKNLKKSYIFITSATGQASVRPTFLSVSYQKSVQKRYSS